MREYTAYDHGFQARLAGKPLSANPHPSSHHESAMWAEGWNDQNQHLNDRDEALDSIGWFGAHNR